MTEKESHCDTAEHNKQSPFSTGFVQRSFRWWQSSIVQLNSIFDHTSCCCPWLLDCSARLDLNPQFLRPVDRHRFFVRTFHSHASHNSVSAGEVVVAVVNEDLGVEVGEGN